MDVFEIVITSKAQSDLAECVGFVLNVSKEAAHAFANDIYSSIESLRVFPERNAVFETSKTLHFTVRKLIINKRYVAFYAVKDGKVVVYRILDSRRKLESLVL